MFIADVIDLTKSDDDDDGDFSSKKQFDSMSSLLANDDNVSDCDDSLSDSDDSLIDKQILSR